MIDHDRVLAGRWAVEDALRRYYSDEQAAAVADEITWKLSAEQHWATPEERVTQVFCDRLRRRELIKRAIDSVLAAWTAATTKEEHSGGNQSHNRGRVNPATPVQSSPACVGRGRGGARRH